MWYWPGWSGWRRSGEGRRDRRSHAKRGTLKLRRVCTSKRRTAGCDSNATRMRCKGIVVSAHPFLRLHHHMDTKNCCSDRKASILETPFQTRAFRRSSCTKFIPRNSRPEFFFGRDVFCKAAAGLPRPHAPPSCPARPPRSRRAARDAGTDLVDVTRQLHAKN